MILRKFTLEDKEEFLAMCRDFYSGGAALEPIPSSRMAESFQQIVSGSPYIQGYMMIEENRIAGYGIVYPFYSNEAGGLCLMLEEIYVKPDFRGKKLGTQYLNSIAEASGEKYVGLKLEICPTNDGARRLYESQGFRVLGYGEMIKKL